MLPAVRRVQQLLARAGAQMEISTSERPWHAAELAAQTDGDVEAILVGGGDGTVCEVVNGLGDRRLPLVILRTGTENLLARELNMPVEPDHVAETLLNGRRFSGDLGLINDDKRFVAIAGVGFDAECVLRMTQVRSGHITHGDYFWPIWRAFWGHRFPELDIQVDGDRVFTGRGLALIGVISRYSVGMRILNRAQFDDGVLDLAVFPCASRTRLVTHASRALLNRHVGRGGVIYRQFRELQITSPGRVSIEIDGEFGGHFPIRCRIQPAAVTFLRPPYPRFPTTAPSSPDHPQRGPTTSPDHGGHAHFKNIRGAL